MQWINTPILPEKAGVYHVMRQWNKDLKAMGQAYFDGTEWKDGNMKELVGPIIAWKPIDGILWE